MSNTIRLPSFLVAGPPRTGTSWLHEILSQHTSLPSPNKETRFFDVHFGRGLKWYCGHFPFLYSDRPMGEIAPTYFASPQAREHIARTIPHAKLIFTFRNPVHRIVSMYRAKRAYGRFPWSFEQALHRDPELLESGKYATHLRAWQRAFPRNQILVAIYDDLRRDPQSFMDQLVDFIAIPRFVLTKAQLGNVYSSETMTVPRSFVLTWTGTAIADWCKARRLDKLVATVKTSPLIRLFLGGGSPFPEVSPETLRQLYELFRPDVDGLETILARDLSVWKAMEPAFSYSACQDAVGGAL
ncbi:MAG: sulfotransferase family protein [Chlamydiota bacterium]